MKRLPLALLATLVTSTAVKATVIYGEDNRVEVSDATASQRLLAKSAATMISQQNIIRTTSISGQVQIAQRSLKEWLEAISRGEKSNTLLSNDLMKAVEDGITFCDGEKFVTQPNPGMCSGFLIAPDLIVTAGHCAEIPNFCTDYRWVFDFVVDPVTKSAGVDMSEDNVYKCKRVISSMLSIPLGLDYAIVKLDRRVSDREPLEIRKDSMIQENSPLFVIGSPSGLPLKVAGGAKVRESVHPFFFKANLDTFQGNSGSGVFNERTGVVEGILVRGEEDFAPNFEKMCLEAKKCKDNECRGEEVTRLTAVPEIGIQTSLNRAAKSGDLVMLQRLLILDTHVDFYTKDGETALMKAAQGAQAGAMKLLLKKKADVRITDVNGDTVLHHLARVLNENNLEPLNVLLNAMSFTEALNNKGQTPLLTAASILNLSGTKALLRESLVNKNAVDRNGETVLFPFTRSNNPAAVKELVSLGVDFTIKNKEGLSVLDLKDENGKLILKARSIRRAARKNR